MNAGIYQIICNLFVRCIIMNNIKKNYFITIEGIDGVGKSTSMAYLEEYLKSKNLPYIVTREPGGTPLAENIRSLLKHHDEPITSETELLLMFAARAQHLAQVIKPALARGETVLCDRFTEASYAYQGGGRGIPQEKIALLENLVQDDFRPDLVILLTAPVKQALLRTKGRGEADRFETEQEHFFERAQETYLARAKQFPKMYSIVDASGSKEEVKQHLLEIMTSFYGQ